MSLCLNSPIPSKTDLDEGQFENFAERHRVPVAEITHGPASGDRSEATGELVPFQLKLSCLAAVVPAKVAVDGDPHLVK